MKAKQIIEEVFDTVLSTKHPYHTQVNDLDVAGDLGSRKKLATVMFRLSQFVDEMEARLTALEARFAPLPPVEPVGETPASPVVVETSTPAPEPIVPESSIPAPEPVVDPAPAPDIQTSPMPEPAPVAAEPAPAPTVDEVTTPSQPNPDPAV